MRDFCLLPLILNHSLLFWCSLAVIFWRVRRRRSRRQRPISQIIVVTREGAKVHAVSSVPAAFGAESSECVTW